MTSGALLTALGVPFTTASTQVDEQAVLTAAEGGPADKAAAVARAKAAAAGDGPEPLVVSADSVVVLDRRILGKPANKDEAAELLRDLRGRPHEVITALAVVRRSDGALRSEARATTVRMRHYSPQDIERYVASGDPLDKAGGYAIQHPEFRPAERISGCYWNVVGLPLCLLGNMVRQMGGAFPGETPDGPGSCPLCQPGGPCPAPDLGQRAAR
ncbi:MAG: Maf family protein [Chloroflexi bacterium]|nr:Maf family protein [Chloroflexota bacterium]